MENIDRVIGRLVEAIEDLYIPPCFRRSGKYGKSERGAVNYL
jgi:hypothetical protein